MNSLLICLITGLCVVSYAPRYTSAAFFYLARLHRCFGVAYVFRVLYMLSKVIETLLLLDRLAMFTPRFRLGGGVTVKGDSVAESLSDPATRFGREGSEASVRIESAFSF